MSTPRQAPGMTQNDKTKRAQQTQKQLEREELRKKCLDYRLMGFTVRQIAGQLDISPATVSKHIRAALDKITAEPAKQLLTMQKERYDQLLGAVMPIALDGDLYAVDRAVAIMRQIERLYGIEKPMEKMDETVEAAAKAVQGIVQLAKDMTKKMEPNE